MSAQAIVTENFPDAHARKWRFGWSIYGDPVIAGPGTVLLASGHDDEESAWTAALAYFYDMERETQETK